MRLEQFAKVRDDLYNFRCPVCGDSHKSNIKARGYLYTFNDANGLVFKCHNCGASMKFSQLLKFMDPIAHKRYILDAMRERGITVHKKVDVDSFNTDVFKSKRTITTPDVLEKSNSQLRGLNRLDKITDNDNECLVYVKSREIPEHLFSSLYYTEDFAKFINSIIPGKIKNATKESRLVIPFFDSNHKVFALQGRSLNPCNPLRYITIKFNEDMGKIFGLERIQWDKKIYVVEGPIDSLFLDNCLAVAGACYNDPILKDHIKNITIIPDNEPGNKEVMANIEKAINMGYKVCIWPRTFKVKDINDAIRSGYTKESLQSLIDSNTFSGIAAQVRLKLWRR